MPKRIDVKIDKAKPTASASAKTADHHTYTKDTWTNQDVTITFSGTDTPVAPIKNTGINSALTTATQTFSTEGAGQSASGTVTDNAGNVSVAATFSNINIDKKEPTSSYTLTAPVVAPPHDDRSVLVEFRDEPSARAGLRRPLD